MRNRLAGVEHRQGPRLAGRRAAGPATATELKEAMGTSRKYASPLLEHFDAQGVTRRDGDVRRLNER